MGKAIKTLAAILAVVVVGLFAAGIERIAWIYSGSGLIDVLPRRLYAGLAGIRCDRPSIEVKRDRDGVLRYRCGDYWPIARAVRSPALTAAWARLKAAEVAAQRAAAQAGR